MARIQSLRLRSFKGFEDFTINFGDFSVLIGPNNAGKSTIIEGLRAAAAMLRTAGRRRGSTPRTHRDGLFPTHSISTESVLSQHENLRHEFHQDETSFELRLAGSHILRAVWPPDDDSEGPFFYVAAKDDVPISSLRYIRENYPAPYIVPVLGPIEQNEPVLTEDYVLQNRTTRLASRHFRNHLLILSNSYEDDGTTRLDTFYRFAHEWLPPGIELERPSTRPGARSPEIDVYYREGRGPKELAWAGDGLQVFLQVLLHIFLSEEAPTLVLDEPDVFLHPDLQRRVVRLLESAPRQVILATHSPEILLESPKEAVTWVDRTRRRAVRAPSEEILDDLQAALGSGVSLRLAQVLRREAVVVVEGEDTKILRRLGATLGRNRLSTESGGLGVLRLEGFDNWPKLEGFSWLADELLEGAVTALVILDRDMRSPNEVSSVIRALSKAGLRHHVWKRHELESYLIVPEALSRLSGVGLQDIEGMVDDVCEELKTEAIANGVKYWSEYRGLRKSDIKVITAEVVDHVLKNWSTRDSRIRLVSGKELLRGINRRIQNSDGDPISTYSLASGLLPDEIEEEVIVVLDEIESL